jgi:hypothetical protein
MAQAEGLSITNTDYPASEKCHLPPSKRVGPRTQQLKHVNLDETIIRVVARQAEAEGVRRAKIIEADGQQQRSERNRRAGRWHGRPAMTSRRSTQVMA